MPARPRLSAITSVRSPHCGESKLHGSGCHAGSLRAIGTLSTSQPAAVAARGVPRARKKEPGPRVPAQSYVCAGDRKADPVSRGRHTARAGEKSYAITNSELHVRAGYRPGRARRRYRRPGGLQHSQTAPKPNARGTKRNARRNCGVCVDQRQLHALWPISLRAKLLKPKSKRDQRAAMQYRK